MTDSVLLDDKVEARIIGSPAEDVSHRRKPEPRVAGAGTVRFFAVAQNDR